MPICLRPVRSCSVWFRCLFIRSHPKYFHISVVIHQSRCNMSKRSVVCTVVAGGFMLNAIFFIAKWTGVWSWIVKRQNSRQRRETFFKTLFFPDNKVACKAEFTQRHGCTNKVCHFSHDPKSSYAQLLKLLQSAYRTLDVCVFTITCHDLADIVIDLHNKGVIVRMITDDEQVDASGSQVGAFRAAGIQVRQDKTPFFMHHKFMVLDGHTLMTGSFNWTRQAIMGNNENLLITNHLDLVSAYSEEFEKLWTLFNPRNI